MTDGDPDDTPLFQSAQQQTLKDVLDGCEATNE